MASVLGTGPVAITTPDGAHLTIPLSALTYNNGAIAIGGWPPAGSPIDTAAIKAEAQDWVDYLLDAGELQAFTPVGTAPAGPAFLVEAIHPGTSGNTIELILSNVTPANPPNMTTLNIAVTVTDTYPGVSLADIADTIGTAVDGGSKPGLIHLVTPPPPPALTQMPDDGQTVPFAAAAATMQATLVGGATDAFTLEAPGDGGGASQFDVAVTNATATTFDLTVTWKKTVTNKTLAEHATAFAYVLNITAPPAGYGVPVEDTYTLHDGHDPTTTPTPATPAEETIPSA